MIVFLRRLPRRRRRAGDDFPPIRLILPAPGAPAGTSSPNSAPEEPSSPLDWDELAAGCRVRYEMSRPRAHEVMR